MTVTCLESFCLFLCCGPSYSLANIYNIHIFFRRLEREEEEREKDPSKKRRRTNGIRKKEPIVAATAQEAMEKVIHVKFLEFYFHFVIYLRDRNY